MTIDHIIAAITAGGLVGLALGATGGGGSLLAMPLLVYLLGVNVQAAAAMSLVVVAAAALLGVYQRRESGEIRPHAALVFSTTGIVGAWVGAFGHRLVQGYLVLLLFGVVMIIAAQQMWRRAGRPPDYPEPDRNDEPLPRSRWIRVSSIGLCVGLLTGFFGVGGGFVIVPVLTVVLGFPLRTAIGTSLLIIALVAIGGIMGHASAEGIDWELTALLLFGAAIGMTAGTYLARTVPSGVLMKSFAVLATGVALAIILDSTVALLGGPA